MSETEGISQTVSSPSTIASARGAIPERYVFVDRIGKGGMGEVHLCRDERTGRELAVKLALPTLDDAARRRFAREALLQARLEHPSFVPVYDVGLDATGEQYFTMRRIQGHTLREVLEGKSESRLGRLLVTFLQLCRAVDFANARGVVHRDLKPENVMLGDFGEVYVLDWGIAKVSGEVDLITASNSGPVPGTQHGVTMGTLGYMPPEQLRGEHAALDGRADVYALGAMLFELLASERLHRGDSYETLARSTVAVETERSPARRAPAREIAPELDAICIKATAPDREQRFASAHDLADALERYLDGDRDLALRRARANELATSASSRLATDRVEAAREAFSALAFDPKQESARQTLISALGEAPATPPAEAVAEVEAQLDSNIKQAQRSGALGVLVFQPFFVAYVFWGDLHQPRLMTLTIGLGVLAAALYLFGSTIPRARSFVLVPFGILCIHNAMFTRWMSPWISVPMAALATLLVSLPHAASKAQRRVLYVAACAVVLVPQALESLGVISRTLVVDGGDFMVNTPMAAPVPISGLVVHFLLMVVTCVLPFVQMVDRNRALELRQRTHAWMLKQVLSA